MKLKNKCYAETLKEDLENVTLLSQMWVYLDTLATDSLLIDKYTTLVQFKIETTNKILEKEIDINEINKDVNKSIGTLRDMCEAYQRFCYEFYKKSSEIEEKLKYFSV